MRNPIGALFTSSPLAGKILECPVEINIIPDQRVADHIALLVGQHPLGVPPFLKLNDQLPKIARFEHPQKFVERLRNRRAMLLDSLADSTLQFMQRRAPS